MRDTVCGVLLVKNSNDSVIQQLEDDVDIGYIYDLGDVQYQGQKVGTMSSLDKTAQELVKLNLEDGRMPYQQDEIVLEEDQFLNLGIPQKIHQKYRVLLKCSVDAISENRIDSLPLCFFARRQSDQALHQAQILFCLTGK